MFTGTLLIKPHFATLNHDTKLFGKMDPYVQVTIGDSTQKTSAAKDQHTEPSWSDELIFEVKDAISLHIEVYHHGLLKDDLIAENYINLSEFFAGSRNQTNQKLPLLYKGADAGFITLDMRLKEFGVTIPENKVTSSTFTVIKETPVIIQDQPKIIHKEVIREQPIIINKERVYSVQPIVINQHELKENLIHEKAETEVVKEQPTYIKESPLDMQKAPELKQAPIIDKNVEFIQEEPIVINETPEVFKKTVIIEKPVIHEKDIIEIEKPKIIEKPMIVTKEYNLPKEFELKQKEEVVNPEVEAVAVNYPSDNDAANIHIEKPDIIKAEPETIREETQYLEKNVVIEKPIIHEQPILYTEKEVVIEKPEINQTRVVEKNETKVYDKEKLKDSQTAEMP